MGELSQHHPRSSSHLTAWGTNPATHSGVVSAGAVRAELGQLIWRVHGMYFVVLTSAGVSSPIPVYFQKTAS